MSPRIYFTWWASCLITLSTLRAEGPEFLRFVRYEDPVYPASLSGTRIKDGNATVAFTVDKDGQVVDAIILEASHSAYGEAVLNAVKRWQLAPEAAWTSSNQRREMVRYAFNSRLNLLTLSHTDGLKLQFSNSVEDGTEPIKTFKWSDLAAPPARLRTANAEYPAALRSEFPSGTAVISFVIDTDGSVRVPAVVAADRAEFGEAALVAVRRWKFEIPRINGRPVSVQVERKFTFGQK